jgi:outer membrane lipoprotein carrier protein
MTRALLVALLAAAMLYGIAKTQAAEPADALLARLQSFTQLQGRFEQHQQDAAGRDLGSSAGRFRVLRPGYFAWEITEPDNQLIIADPEYLWHHDRDLETVTRRPSSAGASASPLQVLGGDQSVLREKFHVEQSGEDSFTLEPLADNPGFLRLVVVFEGDQLRNMLILDNLNQQVSVDLSELDSATPLTPQDFAFTPPEGADVFYYDE